MAAITLKFAQMRKPHVHGEIPRYRIDLMVPPFWDEKAVSRLHVRSAVDCRAKAGKALGVDSINVHLGSRGLFVPTTVGRFKAFEILST